MDFGVQTTTYAPEGRGWLRGPVGTEPGANPSITLDLTLFTANTHYPDGYIKSGCVLGKVTATGLYGPYDDAATDGRQTAKGLLFDSESVRTGQTKALNALFRRGDVDATRLPYTGVAGAIDANGKTDLPLILWD
jgi:hypothetical protein